MVNEGDTLSLAGAEFRLWQQTQDPDEPPPSGRWAWLSSLGQGIAGKTLLWIVLFNSWELFSFTSPPMEANPNILFNFLVLIAAECSYYIIAMRCSRKHRSLNYWPFSLRAEPDGGNR